MWQTLIYGVTAAVFVGMTIATLWHLRWVRRLPALETLPASPDESRIRCSVVVAARNEEARIEQTIRYLLQQRGVELELVVVDDRSTDRTPEILQRMAKEDARIRVKRVDALPEGWLGKCHACHIGASAATGDWILFTDADCWLRPDAIARAVRVAAREDADHIAMASGITPSRSGLAGSHLVFLMGTANWFSGANRDTGKRYLGFGAFNLVRADAYRQCGGYEALRLAVLDDVKLGLLLLQYTIIRTGILLNRPGGQHAIEIVQNPLPLAWRYRIARADVADIFLGALEHPKTPCTTFEAIWGQDGTPEALNRLLDRLKSDNMLNGVI